MQKPTIGAIVHYVSYGTPGGEYPSVCRAAVVTAVDEYQPSQDGGFTGHVSLAVLNPEGMFFNRSVLPGEGKAFDPEDPRPALCGGLAYRGGTWHWPEVDA